jgi:hypothetical protein
MRGQPGQVYFIACEPLNAVKIGFTRQGVLNRLSALQTGCPAPLKLYGCFPGTTDDEQKLHAAFKPLHIQGEWFRFEGKLVDLACYIGETRDRGIFEDALHDALMQGFWHPESRFTEDEYLATGDWTPFRDLLRQIHGEAVDA